MAINYLNSVNLNQNELQHAVIENQPNDLLAGTGVDGQLYFNTQDDKLKIWKNGGWTEVDDFSIGFNFDTNTGVLTATVQNEADVTVDLDGRYALVGDIPTVNDATLTVQGTGVLGGTGTFTANDADNTTISISHDNTSRTDTTSTDTPGYGGTFEAVTGVTTNATGHVTAIDVSTVTIPASDNTDVDVTVGNLRTRLGQISDDTTIGDGTDVDITFSGGVVVAGDLTVSGTTTTVNTETINLADNIVTLNSNATGSATEDAGIEIERGDDTNVSLIWNETNNRWSFTNDGSTYHNIPVSDEYDNFYLDVSVAGSGTQEVSDGGVLTFDQGGGLTATLSGDDTVTYSHADTSSQASVNNSGRTYIQDITLDTYGHITGITSATETVTDTQLSTAAALIDVSAMGSNTTASFTHNLASKNLIVQMYDVTTGEVVFADVDHTSINAISIIFAQTPTNDIRVVVIDAKNSVADSTVTYS